MNKKTFTTKVNDEVVTLSVVKPTLAQDNEANKIYTKTKIKLLNLPKEERPFPQSSVRVKLKESGVWSDEQEKELKVISDRIAELEKIIKDGHRVEDGVKVKLDPLEGRDVALDLMVTRFTQFNLLSEVELFARDITLEKIADKEQLDYLVSVCTLDENNKKYFKDLADYQARQYDQDGLDARAAFENHMSKNTGDWRDDLLEYKFLKKYKFVNDEYQLVNSDGHLVDSEFKLIDEKGNYVDDKGVIIKEAPEEVGNFE